ncbi:MAG: hypothetical protein ACRELZ_01010 [Candidatus Rokuibacteriota bacterium]
MAITTDRHHDGRRYLGGLAIVVVVSALVRVALYAVYAPIAWADTGTYFALARQIAAWSFGAYDGDRTPVYPLLIVLAGLDPHRVYVLQSALGILSAVLFFFITLEFKRSEALAVAVGLMSTLAINQLFMEANLLPEHLSGVLAVASLYVAITLINRRGGSRRAALLGLLVATTALARTGYVVLVPFYALVVILLVEHRRLVTTGSFMAAASLPVLVWMGVNAAAVGQFSLSTRMGLHLMNHSGSFIELAGDDVAVIRDVYLRHRAAVLKTDEAQRLRGGDQYNTIHYAKDDLMAATGLSIIELSRELARLSVRLFIRHPLLYARSVFKAWTSYWTAPIYWKPSAVRVDRVAAATQALWRLEQPLVRLVNLVLVLGLLGVSVIAARDLVRARFRAHGIDRQRALLLVTGGVVVWFSVLQAPFECCENGRYSIPTQQIAIAFIAFLGAWLASRKRIVEPDLGRARGAPARRSTR